MDWFPITTTESPISDICDRISSIFTVYPSIINWVQNPYWLDSVASKNCLLIGDGIGDKLGKEYF